MSIDINKHEVEIDTLFKQNELDLCSIKELYRKLEKLEEKITQIKYIDSALADKLKKDYEKLKRIILDENIQAKLTDDINEINSQLDTKVNKSDQKREMVSRRVRGENNVDSPAGSFDFANFAQQGKETGIASTPIGGVIHHYTDGKAIQIDNVGENNVILTIVNANNPTRRPDKDETFFGSGYYLQLMTNNQNIGQVLSHFVIDEKANFFWNGNSRSGKKNQSTKLTTGKEYGYTPAFIFETIKKHEDMIQFKNGDRIFMVIADNNTVNCAELRATSSSDGMNIKTLKGDIRLQPVDGKNVRISNSAYINKNDGRGAKEVSVIDFGTTSERPTTNLQCGMMFFDRTLNKPIWRNKDNNGWVDAMGTSV